MTTEPEPSSQCFALYTEDYFRSMRELGYEDLKEAQEDRFASLAFGAAGIAFVHWYAGCLERDRRLVERAASWLRAALSDEHLPEAFLTKPAALSSAMPAGSLLLGRTGLHFLDALIAHTLGEARAARQAVSRFATLSRSDPRGSSDVFRGIAGALMGATILYRNLGGRRLLELGRELAGGLIRRARLPGSEPARSSEDLDRVHDWPDLSERGLAHGTLGVLFALLQWSSASGDTPPEWLSGSLARILRAVVDEPSLLCRRSLHHHRLCGGFAGVAIMAARAFQLLGDPAYLDSALDAARFALRWTIPQPDLCCGRAGVTCALLSLARVDPEGPWWRHASELGLSLLLCEPDDWSVAGLYGGEAGLVWLALTLQHKLLSGPPCVDAFPDASPHTLRSSPPNDAPGRAAHR